MCPHSPAMPLAPGSRAPSTVTPPPQPVPMITPKATRAPAAAPSTASESAKQSASLAMRTRRPVAVCRSPQRSRPLTNCRLALRTRPVEGDTEPGMPIPSGVSPEGASPAVKSRRVRTSAS